MSPKSRAGDCVAVRAGDCAAVRAGDCVAAPGRLSMLKNRI
jgi:hypothetical protein